jgi:hypothetical protein
VVIWRNADHYRQTILYLHVKGIAPPVTGANPPLSATITEILRLPCICTHSYNSVKLYEYVQ